MCKCVCGVRLLSLSVVALSSFVDKSLRVVWPLRRQPYGYLSSRTVCPMTKLYCLVTEVYNMRVNNSFPRSYLSWQRQCRDLSRWLHDVRHAVINGWTGAFKLSSWLTVTRAPICLRNVGVCVYFRQTICCGLARVQLGGGRVTCLCAAGAARSEVRLPTSADHHSRHRARDAVWRHQCGGAERRRRPAAAAVVQEGQELDWTDLCTAVHQLHHHQLQEQGFIFRCVEKHPTEQNTRCQSVVTFCCCFLINVRWASGVDTAGWLKFSTAVASAASDAAGSVNVVDCDDSTSVHAALWRLQTLQQWSTESWPASQLRHIRSVMCSTVHMM